MKNNSRQEIFSFVNYPGKYQAWKEGKCPHGVKTTNKMAQGKEKIGDNNGSTYW